MQLQDKVRSDDPSRHPETINELGSMGGLSKGTELAAAAAFAIDQSEDLRVRYRLIRAFSEKLHENLEPEDCVVQTMPEASPVKWHLAHTSWFFETFVLKEALPNHNPIHAHYAYLFNSYYNAAGKMHCRPKRGLISRPTLRETMEYRREVDGMMDAVFEKSAVFEKFAPVIRLGLHYEQQHQELILTDIKHVFSENPLRPVFRERSTPKAAPAAPVSWQSFPAGVCQIGYKGGGFHFDNEGPHHRQFVEDFQLMPRLVTNRGYLEFIEDGGYRRPEFWLSLGWYTVNEQRWEAPLYWEKRNGSWWVFTRLPASRLRKCSATFGNGQVAPILPTRDTRPQSAPLANTTANSCAISTSCEAARALPHSHTSARRTATFSHQMHVGSSRESASPEA